MSQRSAPPILTQLLATSTLQDALRDAIGELTALSTIRTHLINLQTDHDALLLRVVALEANLTDVPSQTQPTREHQQQPSPTTIDKTKQNNTNPSRQTNPSRIVSPEQRPMRLDDYVRIDLSTTPFGFRQGEPERQAIEPALSNAKVPTIFAMQRTPITRAQWQLISGVQAPYGEGAPLHAPATGMTFLEALWFCNRLSEREGLEHCYTFDGLSGVVGLNLDAHTIHFRGLGSTGYRLPLEIEWEAAGRARSKSDSPDVLDRVCWHQGNSGGTLHAVAHKAHNALGLYDMLGNAREFVWNERLHLAQPLQDLPRSWGACRGGSFSNPQQNQRFSHRWRVPVLARFNDVGFRPVRTIEVRQP